MIRAVNDLGWFERDHTGKSHAAARRELLTQTMVGLNVDSAIATSLMSSFDQAAEE